MNARWKQQARLVSLLVIQLLAGGCISASSDYALMGHGFPIPLPGAFEIEVKSDPPGASVKIEGQNKGTTPYTWRRTLLMQTIETYDIQVQYDGYESGQASCIMYGNQKIRASKNLESSSSSAASMSLSFALPPSSRNEDIKTHRRFLENYPESDAIARVRSQLDVLIDHEWRRAQATGTMEAYLDFLQEYGESKYAKATRAAIEELNRVSEDGAREEARVAEARPQATPRPRASPSGRSPRARATIPSPSPRPTPTPSPTPTPTPNPTPKPTLTPLQRLAAEETPDTERVQLAKGFADAGDLSALRDMHRARLAAGSVKTRQAIDESIEMLLASIQEQVSPPDEQLAVLRTLVAEGTSTQIQETSARLLGHFGDVKAIQPLLDVVSNRDVFFMVRSQAAFSLGQIGDPTVIDALRSLLATETDDYVKTYGLQEAIKMLE